VTSSIDAWVKDLLEQPARERLCRSIIGGLSAQDLAAYGCPVDTLWQPLEVARTGGAAPAAESGPGAWLHEAKWRAVRAFQRQVRRPGLRPLLTRVARQCDRLLRAQPLPGDRVTQR
jgi:hypothetical protein